MGYLKLEPAWTFAQSAVHVWANQEALCRRESQIQDRVPGGESVGFDVIVVEVTDQPFDDRNASILELGIVLAGEGIEVGKHRSLTFPLLDMALDTEDYLWCYYICVGCLKIKQECPR